MKKYFFGFILLVLTEVPHFGYPQEKYPWGNADMIIKGDKIWVLSMQGTVSALDINTGKMVADPPERNNNFVAIDTDKKGSIILSRFDRSIVKLDTATLTFKDVYMSPKPIYDVIFDSGNKPYAVTDAGVTDLSTGLSYTADTSFFANHQIRKWIKPSIVTVDANDNIWIGSGHGEWGGELYVFSTSKKAFMKTNIRSIKEPDDRFAVVSLFPVQSIINQNNFTYVSFNFGNSEPTGCIMRFNGFNCDSLVLSGKIWPPDTGRTEYMVLNGVRELVTVNNVSWGDYAGPAVYSKNNNCFYFYCHAEIVQGRIDKDLSKPEAWTQFSDVKSWLREDNARYHPDVLRMSIGSNGKLYLLSQNDGIGVFDGKNFSLLN